MDEILIRFWNDLIGRIDGPLWFRLILHPLTAILLAVHAGIRDARTGRRPYLVVLFSGGVESRDQLRDGWKDVSRVFLFTIILDAVYQAIALRWFYPGEAVVTAVVVAILPYVLLRGPVRRIAERWES